MVPFEKWTKHLLKSQDYFSKVVFVTASTLNTNLILLNSRNKAVCCDVF